MALDEAASALQSLAPGWVVSPLFMYSTIGDVGVGGGLSVAFADDEDFFRKWCMVDVRTERCVGPYPDPRSMS
jgi:hypothetical protein